VFLYESEEQSRLPKEALAAVAFGSMLQVQQHPQAPMRSATPPPAPADELPRRLCGLAISGGRNSPRSPREEIHSVYSKQLQHISRPVAPSRIRKPVKKVCFAEDALLYGGNITMEDVDRSWHTQDEYRRFKTTRKEAIRLIKKNGFNVEELERAGHCLRGFEPYFSLEINRGLKHARDTATRNVLREQERQRMTGEEYNPETIKNLYVRATLWVRNHALQLGRNDAVAAKQAVTTTKPRHSAPLRRAMSSDGSTPIVTPHKRREFTKSSAMQRGRSMRQLTIQADDELDSRHENGIMKKLENAMTVSGKMDLRYNSPTARRPFPQ